MPLVEQRKCAQSQQACYRSDKLCLTVQNLEWQIFVGRVDSDPVSSTSVVTADGMNPTKERVHVTCPVPKSRLVGGTSSAMALDMLPDLAASKIVERLAGQGVFQLLALASLSKQWRSIVRAHKLSELRLESNVSLSQQRSPFQGDMLAVKFLQSSVEQKTQFFASAARLLRQHDAIYCSGEAITDIVILEVAKGSADTFCIEVSLLLRLSSFQSCVLQFIDFVLEASLTDAIFPFQIICPGRNYESKLLYLFCRIPVRSQMLA